MTMRVGVSTRRSPFLRSSLRALQLAALGLALVTVPVAAQDSVAGSWIFTVASPDGAGTMEVPFVFEQNGTAVTGRVDLSVIPEVDGAQIAEGELVDGVLFFLLHVSAQGQVLTAEVEADVDGDEMEGEVYIPDMGQVSPFTAKRGG